MDEEIKRLLNKLIVIEQNNVERLNTIRTEVAFTSEKIVDIWRTIKTQKKKEGKWERFLTLLHRYTSRQKGTISKE